MCGADEYEVDVDGFESSAPLVAPFPYFGGKSKVTGDVWQRLGDVHTYVEPFAGSLAVLLGRPNAHSWWRRRESVGDTSGLVVNFYRAVAADPAAVARHASWPVTEADLTARHLALVRVQADLADQLATDPEYFDARLAGWWVWGISAWVGGEWCSGLGPWHPGSDSGPGVYRKMPMVAGNHGGRGIHKPLTSEPTVLEDGTVDVAGMYEAHLDRVFTRIAQRLRRVRITCGDWSRLTRSAVEPRKGEVTGVFLDPPYDPSARRGDLYGPSDTRGAAPEVAVHDAAREWAISVGEDDRFRIAYCTYADPGEEEELRAAQWVPLRWSASGGYGLQSNNRARENKDKEVIWFSPACLNPESGTLFDLSPSGEGRETE